MSLFGLASIKELLLSAVGKHTSAQRRRASKCALFRIRAISAVIAKEYCSVNLQRLAIAVPLRSPKLRRSGALLDRPL